MSRTTVSLNEARRIVLRAQGLDDGVRFAGKTGVQEIIDHLGYVQIDTIAVIERAHHHTLWNRCSDYSPGHLHDLQAIDRTLFEHWAHALAFLPTSDYRFYLPRMTRMRDRPNDRTRQWITEHANVLDTVLGRIRKEGALTSKDFEPPPGTKRGTWWDWKPAKRALEILFWQGTLMVSERRNFQKVYDLTERVLPSAIDTSQPTEDELARFHIHRALRGLGIAREREIRNAFHIVNQRAVSEGLKSLQSQGAVLPLSVEGLDDVYYVQPTALESIPPESSDRLVILSPFDNLVIQRERLSHLFGFDYTIECYVPAPKRKYGYFVLPILWEDALIGRLDAKAERSTRTLLVKKLWFEKTFDTIKDALPALADALADFARFNGCTTVDLGPIAPTGHKRQLKSLVREALRQPSVSEGE